MYKEMRDTCRLCGETVLPGKRLLHLAIVHRIDSSTFTTDPCREFLDQAIVDSYENSEGLSKTDGDSSILGLLEEVRHIVDLLLECINSLLEYLRSIAIRLKNVAFSRGTIDDTFGQVTWTGPL